MNSVGAAAAAKDALFRLVTNKGRPRAMSTTTLPQYTVASGRPVKKGRATCTTTASTSSRRSLPGGSMHQTGQSAPVQARRALTSSARIPAMGNPAQHQQQHETPLMSTAVLAGLTAAGVCTLWSIRYDEPAQVEEGEFRGWGLVCGVAGGSMCLCKSKNEGTPEDSLQEYANRLNKLRSLRDIFEEYATMNAGGIGKLMTCGDFLRAMLCYRYVGVESKTLKRRCARYINPLLGDAHGLISFDEFCFLMNLVSIPAGLFDVAFAAADSDGSGTIDADELARLVNRLAPPEDADDAGLEKGGAGGDQQRSLLSGQHKRLFAAWFGEDGKGSVPRQEFSAFVRDLRLDIKTVECRLYSRYLRTGEKNDDDSKDAEVAKESDLWLPWLRRLWPFSSRNSEESAAKTGSDSEGSSAANDGLGNGSQREGWWSRYESESITLADLALTLVSTCHPKDLPLLLAKVNSIKNKRAHVPLRDALLLHEVLEDHAQDLEDALGLYCKASSGGSVGPDDFARAAKVVAGQDISPECVWVVFKMFDTGGDGVLQYEELMNATRDRRRRLPGQRESLPGWTRFVQCIRSN